MIECYIFPIDPLLLIKNSVAPYFFINFHLKNARFDGDGMACGLDTGYEDYPYIYFTFPWDGYMNKSVCVSECPTWSQSNNQDKPQQLKCIPNQMVTSCDELINGVDPTNSVQ